MIKTAVLKSFRVQEFMQFMRNTLMIVNQHKPDKLKILSQYNALNQHFLNLEEAYKQDSISELTPQLGLLDDRRDQAIMCLRQISGGYLHHYDENKVAASKRLVDCIDKYGSKLYSLNHNAETTALKNLIRDLQSKTACLQALKELQLEAVVDEMNQANTEFEALFIQRLEEYSQYEFRSNKELNRMATEAYRLLVQHVEAHAVLTPAAEPYTSLINHLNENVEHFNQMVERRKRGLVVQEEGDTVTDEEVDSPVA